MLGMLPKKPIESSTLRLSIVMEYMHVMFDDKKIQGLEDEGFHEILQFKNETDGDMEYDSDDDDLIRNSNMKYSINC